MQLTLANALPHMSVEWKLFLDLETFLQLQSASGTHREAADGKVSYLASLLGVRLGLPNMANLKLALFQRDYAGEVLRIGGEIGSRLELWTNGPYAHTPRHASDAGYRWWTALQAFTALNTSTLENDLRCLPEHYYDLEDWTEEFDYLFEEVAFSFDDHGRCLSCRLLSRIGNDRCVLAKLPLPRPFSTSAFPRRAPTAFPSRAHARLSDDETWCLAHRCWSYYEISIGVSQVESQYHQQPCIAIGLATGDLDSYNVCEQLPGWNEHSWALHGDDGKIFHNTSHGKAFRPVSRVPIDRLKGCGFPQRIEKQSTIMPTFGPGDVVGCGIILMVETWLGIFFTLNGQMLGVAFLMENTPDLELYPCVGIDAPWPVTFNFGRKPFLLDCV